MYTVYVHIYKYIYIYTNIYVYVYIHRVKYLNLYVLNDSLNIAPAGLLDCNGHVPCHDRP